MATVPLALGVGATGSADHLAFPWASLCQLIPPWLMQEQEGHPSRKAVQRYPLITAPMKGLKVAYGLTPG